MDAQTEERTEYLSCAETAKMLRIALKKEFPGVKFSVRSSTYSGGASIDISWMDGPRASRVEAVAKKFEGADFDGMVDLKTSRQHYIAEGGEPVLAYESGSGATIQRAEYAAPDVPNVRRVHLGADYVFCHRRVSEETSLCNTAEAIIRTHCRTEGTPPHDQFGNRWVTDLARGMVRAIDFEKGTSLEDTFREVVLGERP